MKKTKCLPFITSHTNYLIPELSVKEGSHLEVVYKFKLVGLVVSSDMTWSEYVSYTVKRVTGVQWQLTRLKQTGGCREKLVKFYILMIRSILMFGVVCFHSSLNLEQRHGNAAKKKPHNYVRWGLWKLQSSQKSYLSRRSRSFERRSLL